MQISNVTFADVTDPPWVLRLKVEGSGFLHRAAPVSAYVGDVEVEYTIVNPAGDGFSGLLRTLPADGAQVRVGYLDTELVDINWFYHSAIA